MYSVNKQNGYIYSVVSGEHITGNTISPKEYEAIRVVMGNIPPAPDGFGYRLKENLEWELYELPESPEIQEEATEADYIAALAELGVTLDEEI